MDTEAVLLSRFPVSETLIAIAIAELTILMEDAPKIIRSDHSVNSSTMTWQISQIRRELVSVRIPFASSFCIRSR
ncbi:hypothetical protein PENPOL_c007G00275 [Penicillium polonicum]|uniref:Uncharacterized protein n=1 Tax=Penicillium polonicum TaxID=60169 RepID=A0A1V6NI86_PENPO|nr:hypothetical protein PENPOL_c007G00275 [Penicillium polonicum]